VSYAYSPLFNFISKAELVSIEKNLTIRKVPKEEREVLRNNILPPSIGNYIGPTSFLAVASNVAACEYALIVKGESKYADAEFQLSSDSIITSILSSLRLFKEGGVTAGITVFSHEAEPKYWAFFGPPILSRPFGPPYVLFQNEVDDFLEFWRKYKNVDVSKGPLRVAVRRFNRSYDMTVLNEDKLIDYMIALEALYLKEKIQDIGKALALSASYLIGEDKEQREQIYNALRKAYIKRNSIVHGEIVLEGDDSVNVSGKDISFDDFTYLIEEYLRRSIKKHLNLPVKYERDRWDLENLELKSQGSQGKLNRVGNFNGCCPFCEGHIGIYVFEDQRKQKHAWCASCRREIFKNIEEQKIVWKNS